MSFLRVTYLVFAILGGIKPMIHFLAWFNEFGYSWAGIVSACAERTVGGWGAGRLR